MPGQENDIKHYSAEDLARYHSGNMTEREMHALEKAALDDPFLADALDGYVHTTTPIADISELKNKLLKKETNRKVVWFRQKTIATILKIAAILVVLTGAGLLLYRNNSPEKREIAVVRDIDTQKNETNNNRSDTTATKQTEERIAVEPSTNTIQQQTVPYTEAKSIAGIKTAETKVVSGEATYTWSQPKNGIITDSVRTGNIAYADNTNQMQNNNFNNAVAGKLPGAQVTNAQMKDFNKPLLKGKVTDDNGKPVPFATIVDQKNKQAIATDAEGKFEITKKDSAAEVAVNAAGYKSVTRKLSTDSTANNIVMAETDNTIKEVIVTPAFQTKRTMRSQSSNVQHVSSEQLNTVRSSNINDALAGKVAGVQVRSQGTYTQAAKDEKAQRVTITNAIPVNGWQQFKDYVSDSLKTIQQLAPTSASTEVAVTFNVNEKGEAIDIKIKKSLCIPCNKEAIRIFKSGPPWQLNDKNKKANAVVRF